MAANTYRSANPSANGIVRFSLLLLCMGMLEVAFACNGYKITLKKFENCAGTNAVITVDNNFSVVLTPSCEIQARGCVRVKDFQTGKGTYAISKDGKQLLQGSIDLCGKVPTGMEFVTQFLRSIGVPEKCPITARNICITPTQSINISGFKQFLPLAQGSISVDLAVQHNSGKSCLKITLDITK